MNVADLARAMEAIAPARLAAPWDNVGLLVGDPRAGIARILLAIDCTRRVLDEAIREGCGAIVSYHPPIFEPQKRFVAGSIPYDSACARIAVCSPHTALDAVVGGTNDVLADAVGLFGRAALRPVEDAEHPGAGFGRVGGVPRATLRALVERVKRELGLTHVLVAGPLDRDVSRVAVCAGSGGDLVSDAVAAGAEVLLTGELRHHDTLRAVSEGLVVLCTLHSASERAVLGRLQSRLREELTGADLLRSREDREPLEFA
jgi:GTP cyclohydrolase I